MQRLEINTNTGLEQGDNAAAGKDSAGLQVLKHGLNENLLAFLILIILNLIVYAPTLSGYFLADDFVHVAYLADVFAGHPGKLLDNFCGNWMNAWGTQFYRPLISLSLALDFWLGKGSAIPFHLSNTFYHLLAGCFLFLVCKRLLSSYSKLQSFIASLFAAAFFTLSPLHGEVVSWVIGRVDGLCLAFFMPAYYFFLKAFQDHSKAARALSLVCFVLSLLCKEMAVTLLPLVVLTVFFFAEGSVKQRALKAIEQCWSYAAVLGSYFVLRLVVLGTAAGGYGGSVGEGLSSSFWQRFQSLQKLLLPFNGEITHPQDRWPKQLGSLYRLLGVFLALRFLFFRQDLRQQVKLVTFLAGWFLLALIPTYQVFNITDSLMCSRFAYFATVPFSILLAVLIAPLFMSFATKSRKRTFLLIASGLLLFGFSLMYAQTAVKNNKVWAAAFQQVRQFRSALAARVATLEPGKKLALLNTPQRLAGAHLVYNGAMLHVLLSEPLSRPAINDKVASFEAATYGDGDLLNSSRLKALLDSGNYQFVFWDMQSLKLLDLNLQNKPLSLEFDLSRVNERLKKLPLSARQNELFAVESPQLNLNPASADFVILRVKLSPGQHGLNQYLRLYWSASGPGLEAYDLQRSIALPLAADGAEHDYVFPTAQRKIWQASGNIKRLKLELPGSYLGAGSESEFVRLQILSSENLMPVLRADSLELAEGLDGIYRRLNAQSKIKLRADASKISACKNIVLELSRPNSWFEHYAGTHRETKLSDNCALRLQKQGQLADFELEPGSFSQPAYYQVRIFALDQNGKVLGFCSDPLNLQIN